MNLIVCKHSPASGMYLFSLPDDFSVPALTLVRVTTRFGEMEPAITVTDSFNAPDTPEGLAELCRLYGTKPEDLKPLTHIDLVLSVPIDRDDLLELSSNFCETYEALKEDPDWVPDPALGDLAQGGPVWIDHSIQTPEDD